MLDLLLQPAVIPFAVALGIMLTLAVIELVTVLIGFGLSGVIDSLLPDVDLPEVDLDLDGGEAVDGISSPGVFGSFAAWLCIGRVPALIIFIAFLTAFGLSGVIIQQVAQSVSGAMLGTLVAVAVALLVSLPLTRYFALAFAWIMPQEETEAVEQQSFLGQVAQVIRGTARPGEPAEAKLADRFGTVHYLLVEPEEGNPDLTAGSKVLILEKRGATYLAAEAEEALADVSKL